MKTPSKLSVYEIIRYLKGKSTLTIFDKFPEYRQKGDKRFCSRGYYIDTVAQNEVQIRKYIKAEI